MFRQLTHRPKFPAYAATSFRFLTRFLLLIALGATALFFTADAVKKYDHIRQIRANGRLVVVNISKIERKRMGKSTQKNRVKRYRYRAVFRYHNQERVISITKEMHAQLKPADSIRVFYDSVRDDFRAENFPIDYRQLITPLIFWVIFGGISGHYFWIWRIRNPFIRKPHGKLFGDRLHRSRGQFAGIV